MAIKKAEVKFNFEKMAVMGNGYLINTINTVQ